MKRHFILMFAISLIVIYALSCATAPKAIVPSQAELQNIETVNASFDEVFNAFMKYFADRGIPIEISDKFTGQIVTKDITITDMFMGDYLRKDKDSPYYGMPLGKLGKSMESNGVKLSFCDCGLPQLMDGLKVYSWQNLFCKYQVDIKEAKDNKTTFRVQALFWTEIFRMWDFWVTYEGNWECASTGEYEKKVIEEITTNYLEQ